MPRLFTGLALTPSLKAELALLRGGLFGARWADPDDYHLTLRFIGDVDDRTAHAVADALAEARFTEVDCRITHLDVFGGNRPHTLYAAVAPTASLLKLQADHERLMRRLGLAGESRKFTPHVTLARLGRDANPRRTADYLGLRGGYSTKGFTAEDYVLFSARDGGGGPYLIEESYPLAPSAPARALLSAAACTI